MLNTKQCTKCKEWFPPTIEYFHKDRQKKTGLSSNCKICRSITKCNYYIENNDKILEYAKEYYKENKHKILTYQKNNYSTNRNRLYSRKWREQNPVKYRAKARRDTVIRAARKKNLPFNWSKQELDFCLTYWDNKCVYCERNFEHLDHFIPLTSSSKIGTVATNMLPACKKCNLRKNAKNPEVWVYDEFGEDRGFLILEKIMSYFDHLIQGKIYAEREPVREDIAG